MRKSLISDISTYVCIDILYLVIVAIAAYSQNKEVKVVQEQ